MQRTDWLDAQKAAAYLFVPIGGGFGAQAIGVSVRVNAQYRAYRPEASLDEMALRHFVWSCPF